MKTKKFMFIILIVVILITTNLLSINRWSYSNEFTVDFKYKTDLWANQSWSEYYFPTAINNIEIPLFNKSKFTNGTEAIENLRFNAQTELLQNAWIKRTQLSDLIIGINISLTTILVFLILSYRRKNRKE